MAILKYLWKIESYNFEGGQDICKDNKWLEVWYSTIVRFLTLKLYSHKGYWKGKVLIFIVNTWTIPLINKTIQKTKGMNLGWLFYFSDNKQGTKNAKDPKLKLGISSQQVQFGFDQVPSNL